MESFLDWPDPTREFAVPSWLPQNLPQMSPRVFCKVQATTAFWFLDWISLRALQWMMADLKSL